MYDKELLMDDPYDPGKVYKGDPESYPSFKPNTLDLSSPAVRSQLKELINDVLDDRMRDKGQYESDEWLYRGTY